MKKFIFFLLITALFACNNEAETDKTRADTTVIEQDNTINRDTGMINIDTMNRDTIKK